MNDKVMGRPSLESIYDEPIKRSMVSLTVSQREWLMKNFGGISNGVRVLVERAMETGAEHHQQAENS